MGGSFSNFDEKTLTAYVSNEFENHKGTKKRDYLVLTDILSINLPEDYAFNFFHLGHLFCMDNNKDGRFSLEDLQAFAKMAIKQISNYRQHKQHEINAQLQAYCTL